MSYLGRFLVEQGAITEAQLEDGLRFQAECNRRIGAMAVEKGLLTPDAVEAICRVQWRDASLFGDIAVRERRLSRRAMDELLFLQKVHYTYLGEALLLRGHISPEQYRQLLGRHYALQDDAQVSLRYLNDFFAENRILDILVNALARAVRRFAGEPLTVAGVGRPFDPTTYPARALVEGTVFGDRRLGALFGLSADLAGRLEASRDSGEIPGLEVFFTALGHYFRDMLRDDGLLLEEEHVTSADALPAGAPDCAFVRCGTPSGQAGVVLWLAEAGT